MPQQQQKKSMENTNLSEVGAGPEILGMVDGDAGGQQKH